MNVEIEVRHAVRKTNETTHLQETTYEGDGRKIVVEDGDLLVATVGNRLHAESLIGALSQAAHGMGATLHVHVDETRTDLLNEAERQTAAQREQRHNGLMHVTAAAPRVEHIDASAKEAPSKPDGSKADGAVQISQRDKPGETTPKEVRPAASTAFSDTTGGDVVHDQNFPNREGTIDERNQTIIGADNANHEETENPAETAQIDEPVAAGGATVDTKTGKPAIPAPKA